MLCLGDEGREAKRGEEQGDVEGNERHVHYHSHIHPYHKKQTNKQTTNQANVNAKDKDGTSSLMAAAVRGHKEVSASLA